MMGDQERIRRRALERTERFLRARGNPRFHMLLIVSATGACAFLFSFLMLLGGVSAMWLRYPLAVGFSYVIFLSLLRLWLGYQGPQVATSGPYDALDAGMDIGHFVPYGDGVSSDVAGGALDLEEGIFVLIALAALGAGFLVCVYIVWTGPALLAELLVDGIVMSRIYKRIKLIDRADWLPGALRRTCFAAVLVAAFFGVAGFALQKIAPDAKSIGPVVEQVLGQARG